MAIELTDTAGHERYHSLAQMIYRESEVAIVGFDVTNLESLQVCDRWIKELRDADQKVFSGIVVAVGNKIDLVDSRTISTEDAEEHFSSMDPPIPYFETSAKTGEGVTELFQGAMKIWIDKQLSTGQTIINDNEKEEEKDEKGKKCIIQ